MSSLDSYYGDIQFTMEIEKNSQTPFSDALLIRNLETISTTVYCKVTNTDYTFTGNLLLLVTGNGGP